MAINWRSHILLIFFFLVAVLGKGQHWQGVEGGVDNVVVKLKAIDDTLYAGENPNVANTAVNWLDSNGWKGVGNKCNGGPIHDIVEFQGEVYINGGCGTFRLSGDSLTRVLSTHASGIYPTDSLLYAFGNFDSIAGIEASRIARYDGNTWSALDTTTWYSSMTHAIEYKGDLYVGGNMDNYNGSIKSLARWDGQQWHAVDSNALANGIGSIGSFAIYNNDLWIGGLFNQGYGNPYNGIARWDGSQFLDPGGGTESSTSTIWDMEVFNNELYLCGNFSSVAGMDSVKRIAKWNGTDWCGLGFTSDDIVITIESFENELYIGGNFEVLEGDTVNYIAKWVGGNYTDTCANTTAVKEASREPMSVRVYPNPSSGMVRFKTPSYHGTLRVTLYDLLGTRVKKRRLGKAERGMAVGDLPSGMYMIEVITDEQERFRERLIVR